MSALNDVLSISLMFFATWAAGQAVEEWLGWPALCMEIVVGMALGPRGFDLVPFDKALISAGQLGLLLLVLEGGMHIELATLRRVGWKAFAIALSGTALPVLGTLLVFSFLPAFSFSEALIMGTSLSSTAIGMASKLMADSHMLEVHLGQLICCAAMIDDVASLVLLAMISSASPTAADDEESEHETSGATWGPTEGIWSILVPLFSSLVFLAVSWGLASMMPSAILALRHAVSSLLKVEEYDLSSERGDEAMALYEASLGSTAPRTCSSKEGPWTQKEAPSLPPLLSDRFILALIFIVAAGLIVAADYARTVSIRAFCALKLTQIISQLITSNFLRPCYWGASWPV